MRYLKGVSYVQFIVISKRKYFKEKPHSRHTYGNEDLSILIFQRNTKH